MLDLTSPTSPLPENRWSNQLPSPSVHNQTHRTQVPRARQRQSSSTRPSHSSSTSTSASASNNNTTPPPFRNVSACNRCRLRKHRCDQRLPRCESCEKAGARCVGYDPLTKRELPRSYVSFLESRVAYLVQVLIDHNIDFKPATAYDEDEILRLEAGGRRASPEVGMKEGIVARSSVDGSGRKRKISSVEEEEEEQLPPRQMKRLCRLSLLLKEFFNDGCTRRHYGGHDHDEAEQEHHEDTNINNPSGRINEAPSLSQPWSPSSFESTEHSDNHTISGSESPEYPQRQYHHLNTGNEISAYDGMFGQTRGPRVYGVDARPRINLGSDVVDFEFDMPDVKPRFSSRNGNGNGKNTVRRRDSLSEEEQAEADAKFDIGAELLRQRTEKANYDLLDEFLVGWRDCD